MSNSSVFKSRSKLPKKIPTTRLAVPRRRSNSFSDLKTSTNLESAASTSALHEVQNLEQQPARTTVRTGMRKSKSFADLNSAFQSQPVVTKNAKAALKRPIDTKSSTASKKPKEVGNLEQRPARTTVRTGIRKTQSFADLNSAFHRQPASTKNAKAALKRPTDTKSSTAAKKPKESPKPKQAKPAPYDYKARFNILLEKHKEIKQTAAEDQRTLTVLTDDYNAAREQLTIQSQELEKGELKIQQLQQSLELVKRENSQQATAISELTNENKTLHQFCNKQKDDLDQLRTAFDKEVTEHAACNQERDELRLKVEWYAQEVERYAQAEIAYKEALKEAEENRKYMHNCIQELKGNIRVFCRVRPANCFDRPECNINYLDEGTLEIQRSKESLGGRLGDLKTNFNFDRVYPPQAQQDEIFNELSQLVQSALDGYHVCIFAYGQTGSGKTYTMQGLNNLEQQGMIPRSIEQLFKEINRIRQTDSNYEIQASFLEIYNETLRDLLRSSNCNEKLTIQYNEGKGVLVTNLTIKPVKSAKELLSLMELANTSRAVAATNFNEHSSRSHAVTRIYIKSYNKSSKCIYEGSLNFVDLAGSESAKTSTSERLQETKSINKSLSAFGDVMLALHNKNSHVPYRNSKLTYLLQSCLGGNSKTLMILNISPFEDCYGETLNSLRFAMKVKTVKTDVRRNKTYDKEN